MCYSIIVSTTSPRNLNDYGSPRIRFEQGPGDEHADLIQLLSYPHIWFLTREFGGCSCHFRHIIINHDTFFAPVAEWENLDEDDHTATQDAYLAFLAISGEGHGLEFMNLWSGVEKSNVKTVAYDLKSIHPAEFRFPENHLFRITLNPISGPT